MDDFAHCLLGWFEHHGRKQLPWQREPTPYRVWVSEIMLQQTQVATVIPYFERFMQRFPDLQALACAPLDDVLHHWSGLGYYARGRNLHRAAGLVVEQHRGELPADLDSLVALPGIGRSTAGAILALGHGRRAAILDGNVKRVLARFHGVAGWPGESAVARQLWRLAEAHTPRREFAAYTQAIMDLGATLCRRSSPRCGDCPLGHDCVARREERVAELPGRKPRRERPQRHTVFLLLRDPAGRVLLERRPPAGIWGGLWGFPECHADDDPHAECLRRFALAATGEPRALGLVQHGFTHFDLDIQPLLVEVRPAAGTALESTETLWYNPDHPAPLGLAAPVARLVDQLARHPGETR